jgi:epoxide hydrolase-like predicted phosphatase
MHQPDLNNNKALVFDFGGVLFGWQPTRLLRRALPEVASDEASAQALAAQFFQAYGGDWTEFDRGALQLAEVVQRIAQRTGLAEAEVQRVVDSVPAELAPIAETVAWLKRLHAAGQPLFFLSNMPAPFADFLESTHDFIRCFGDGVFSARVGVIKPEPAIFELAARRFGRAPADLVFLDDHADNVQAAQAMGWNALLFTSAAQAEQTLRERAWL